MSEEQKKEAQTPEDEVKKEAGCGGGDRDSGRG